MPPRSSRIALRSAFFTAIMWLLTPQRGDAEESISYKWQRYQESDDRIKVVTQSAVFQADLPKEIQFKLSGIIDAIAGASPNGSPAPTGTDQVPLTRLSDRRKAWNTEVSRQFARVNIGIGYANSREHDYVSNGGSINTVTDFNQKNTTLLLGFSHSNDDVLVPYYGSFTGKRANDAIAGITQLIDKATRVIVNLGYSEANGFLNDQYKIIQKNTQILPGLFLPLSFAENRPRRREKVTFFVSVNHAVDPLNGALEGSYRYFTDNAGMHSHTISTAWFQKIGEHFILSPNVRFYDQTAANYYYVSLDNTSITPTRFPTGTGPFYSADYRLSALRTYNYGMKATYVVRDGISFDASVDRYEMRGKDGVTSGSAYPKAITYALGATLSF